MRMDGKLKRFVLSIPILFLMLPGIAGGQQIKSLVASASGEGTIKLGKEQYKLNAVVVKLFEDGKAEINLITDITIFISGTWSRPNDTSKTIDLKITGNAVAASM